MQAFPNALSPIKKMGTVMQSRVAIQSHHVFEVYSHKTLAMDPQLELKLHNSNSNSKTLKLFVHISNHICAIGHTISWRPSASMGSRQSRKAPPPDGCATKATLVLFFPTWQKRQRQRKTTPHMVDSIDTCAGSGAHNGSQI